LTAAAKFVNDGWIPRLRPGQPARRGHDYKRHLFAALNIATGRIIGMLPAPPRR
jgi:hypothetical protein